MSVCHFPHPLCPHLLPLLNSRIGSTSAVGDKGDGPADVEGLGCDTALLSNGRGSIRFVPNPLSQRGNLRPIEDRAHSCERHFQSSENTSSLVDDRMPEGETLEEFSSHKVLEDGVLALTGTIFLPDGKTACVRASFGLSEEEVLRYIRSKPRLMAPGPYDGCDNI